MLLAAIPRTVHASAPIVLEKGTPSYAPGQHVEYLEDADGKLTVEEVTNGPHAAKFKPSPRATPNFGFTKSAYWYRFDVKNPLTQAADLVLEIAYPPLDRIELYLPKPGGGFKRTVVGDSLPHGNKPLRHYHYLLPVHVDAGQRLTALLRVKTLGSMQLPLRLWTTEGLRSIDGDRLLAWGVYFGILFAMLVYNLFLVVGIRDLSYLYYVLYIAGSLVYQASFEGFAQEYLWPGVPWLANRAMIAGIALTSVGAILFSRRFLASPQLLPRYDKPGRIVLALATVVFVGAFILPYNPMVIAAAVLAFPAALWCLGAGILAWRAKYRPARYFLAAWVTFLLGVFALVLEKFGVLPRNLFTNTAHELGFAMNVILLSFSLADRINTVRREHQRAQHEALELKSQAAETLEKEVEAKTRDLQQKTREAVEANKAKTEFFANVSHELRTPLSLILAPLERMKEGASSLPKDVARRLPSMEANTYRLLRLVNQLLDVSRLESRATPVSFEKHDVRSLVEPIVAAFEPFARSKGLTLELRGPDALPEAYIDPPKLDKVLCNLLSNACKFTDAGSIIVRLTHDDAWLTISVKDTGAGIAEEHQEKVFERFGQVDGSASRQHEGSGIGLSLSRELAELTGGKLELESEPGAGSTFRVRLPLGTDHIADQSSIRRDGASELQTRAIAAAKALDAEEGAPDRYEFTDVEHRTRTEERPLLLVVEDNADMRGLVAEICQREFQVIEAGDGERGLALIKEHRPALVISDVMMPKLDGHQLVQQLRADPETASIPVILLTAKTGPELLLEGLERGADDYLTKPFSTRELLARARNLVRFQRQERALAQANRVLQQQLVKQTSDLERARGLARFLPPHVAQAILDGEEEEATARSRCRLTVFRLELRGFDSLLEVIEAEDMIGMLNGYLSEIVELAFAHGATISSFVRDTVVGFFGAPHSEGFEQDALKCAEMSAKMFALAGEICRRWRPLAQDRMPVPTMILSSGYATVGYFGPVRRMEYAAVGGPMDEARAALPTVAPGELVCTQSVWSVIEGKVEGEACGEVMLPQRPRPLRLFLLGTAAAHSSSDGGGWRDSGATRPPARSSASLSPVSGEHPSFASCDDLPTGTLVADRYKVLRRLGTGGMATIYLAQDMKLGVEIALKLLKASLHDDERKRARLYREVKLARLVSHPNVGRIFDLGSWGKHEFITMGFVKGPTLRQILQASGALGIDRGLAVMAQLCAGLSAAHAVGVIHRDLKPENIILDGELVVILDFGLARWMEPSHDTETNTRGPIGTPHYMAPEQFTGDPVDHRVDIYALGVVAYEMFTGRRPFEAPTPVAVAYQHAHEAVPDPQELMPALPPRLVAVLLRCLEKLPQDRFSLVSEVIDFVADLVPRARRGGPGRGRAPTEAVSASHAAAPRPQAEP